MNALRDGVQLRLKRFFTCTMAPPAIRREDRLEQKGKMMRSSLLETENRCSQAIEEYPQVPF